jgi:hypothetical protein
MATAIVQLIILFSFMRCHAGAYRMRDRVRDFQRLSSFLLFTISLKMGAEVGTKGTKLSFGRIEPLRKYP